MARNAFHRLADNLAELAGAPSRITKSVCVDLNVYLARQFTQGKDPYGMPWRPLMPRTILYKGHSAPMVNTGRTARETRARPMSGAGIELVTTDYMQYHHGDRSVLPDREDLPLVWQRAIQTALDEEFRRVLKR